MSKTLFILRGHAGSGKSTLASIIEKTTGATVCSADYFPGLYFDNVYQKHLIKYAHAWCWETFIEALGRQENIILDNTCIRDWEYKDYLNQAAFVGYSINIIHCEVALECFDGGRINKRRSIHAPQEVSDVMKRNFVPFTQTEDSII